ncbi:EI24 domain-containing protein [Sulfurimonas sp. HSL-1716]|uniref:EI24 domain-containing protein n=1 Tax=Hydrocurvibacter sulfurireducens TaxID=3131937 RepID=UPI0031F96D71
MKQNEIFITSIKDFFTLKMMKYSVAPFIATMVVIYALFFYFAGSTVQQLHQATLHVEQTQSNVIDGVENTDSFVGDFKGSSVVEFLMSHAVTAWIMTFLFYTVGSMLALVVSIFIAVIVIAFLTPFVLKELQKKHYSDIEMKGHDNFFISILKVIKWFLIMTAMLILFVPFYFVPILNVIMFNIPMYYFFHKMITYDVSSNINTNEEYKKIMFFSGNDMRIKTFVLYLVSLIPFAILFGGIFYVIFMGHAYFKETRELRLSDNNSSI